MDFEYSNKYLQLSMFPDERINSNKTFRPIHYLGSKLRILEFIKEAIDEIDTERGRVVDLFSGSGSVASYLSHSRPVTAVDIQEYSRVLTSAILNPMDENYDIGKVIESCLNSKHYKMITWCMEPLLDYEEHAMEEARAGNHFLICELVEKSSIITQEYEGFNNANKELSNALSESISRMQSIDYHNGPQALVSRYYGGAYFSFSQTIVLDTLLEYTFSLKGNDKDTFLAAILSTASDIVNTVGKQFAQPIKALTKEGEPKKNVVQKIFKDRSKDAFEVFSNKLETYLSLEGSNFNHSSLRMDYSKAFECLGDDVTIVYADPPYTRYHYSRYYHVLETLCLRDNPRISKNKVNGIETISRGLYREERHQSPFSISTQAYNAFEILFKKTRELGATLVLSYSPFETTKESTPRIQTIDGLKDLGGKYFNNIEVKSPGIFSHSKLNNSERNFDINHEAEVLLIFKN